MQLFCDFQLFFYIAMMSNVYIESSQSFKKNGSLYMFTCSCVLHSIYYAMVVVNVAHIVRSHVLDLRYFHFE